MSMNVNECALTASETWTSGEGDPSYSLTDDGNALTLRMGGAAYRNIKRIADAMNRVSIRRGLEADAGNTPLTVFWNFELEAIRLARHDDAREHADLVCDGIDATPDFVKDLRSEVRGIDFEG